MKRIVTNIFTGLTALLLFLWIQYPDLVQWEAFIGIAFLLKEVIIQWQMRRIESLEYSPAISIAHGYVNNFLEPAIGELIASKGVNVNFKIYIPNGLEELSDQQIDRMKHQIKSMGYHLKEIKLKRSSGRPHDVLTIEKQQGSISYFDFPRTLLSLQSYIDYKVDSGKNESTDHKKNVLGKKMVDAFQHEVKRLLKKKNLEESVSFVDKSLEI